MNWLWGAVALFMATVTIGSWVRQPDLRRPVLLAVLATAVSVLILQALGVDWHKTLVLVGVYWVAFPVCAIVALSAAAAWNVRGFGWALSVVAVLCIPAFFAWAVVYTKGGGAVDLDCPTTYDRQGPYRDC